MTNSRTGNPRREDALPTPADGADLWSRLHESLERLANMGDQNQEPAVRTEKLAARARQLRGRLATSVGAEAPAVFVAFSKGSHRYGIPVHHVIEVQRLRHFTPVAGTPAFVVGVMNWRGDVLSVLDVGELLGLAESGLADIHVCLVLQAAGRRMGLAALEIEEIHAVPESSIKPAPHLPGDLPPEWLLGIHDGNRMILNVEIMFQDSRLVEWRKE